MYFSENNERFIHSFTKSADKFLGNRLFDSGGKETQNRDKIEKYCNCDREKWWNKIKEISGILLLEYQDVIDGSWKEAAKVESYQWQSDSAELEENRVVFPEPVETTAVRIKVLNANLRWRHFAINEVKFWNH